MCRLLPDLGYIPRGFGSLPSAPIPQNMGKKESRRTLRMRGIVPLNSGNPFYGERILRGGTVRAGRDRKHRNMKMCPAETTSSSQTLPNVYAALATFPLRDQTMVALGLNTGLRVTELLSLYKGWQYRR
jgi:hypothetical protein